MLEHRRLDLLVFGTCVSVLVLFVMYAIMLSIVHFPAKSSNAKAEVQSPSNSPAMKPASAATDAEHPPTATPAPEPSSSAAIAPVSPADVSAPGSEAEAAPPKPETDSVEYAVDAGLFRDPANAAGVVKHLPAQFKPLAQITPLKMRSGMLYRVRIIVDDKGKADALAQALLTQQKLRALVTPLP
jgi:hypothetical protein